MNGEICMRESCTSCAACASICPVNCIRMEPDKEGFLQPVIDSKVCIDCGRCRKTCPVNDPFPDDGIEPMTFAARVMDEHMRAVSSSGGIFSALALQILRQKGIVIGAGFDIDHQVAHKICTEASGLDELRRSKYVQSRIGTVYQEAKQYLDAGKEVLFCGTPCQIGGIKAYYGKEYEGLYTVDFICHGVPSPLAYSQYLRYLKDVYQSDICEVNFRNKTRGWGKYSFSVRFENGREYCEPVSRDYYLRSFIMNMDLRPSCYHCHFKQAHHQSDITLADFWGVDSCLPDWNDDTGVSLVMIHSDKGHALFDSCSGRIEKVVVPFINAVEHNPSMTQSVSKPALRDSFMRDLGKLPFDKLHRKYCGINITSRIRRKIAQVLLK